MNVTIKMQIMLLLLLLYAISPASPVKNEVGLFNLGHLSIHVNLVNWHPYPSPD